MRRAEGEKTRVRYDRWSLMIADSLQKYGQATKEQLAFEMAAKKGISVFEAYASKDFDELIEDKMYKVYLNLSDTVHAELKKRGFTDSKESFFYLYELPNTELLLTLPEDELDNLAV